MCTLMFLFTESGEDFVLHQQKIGITPEKKIFFPQEAKQIS